MTDKEKPESKVAEPKPSPDKNRTEKEYGLEKTNLPPEAKRIPGSKMPRPAG